MRGLFFGCKPFVNANIFSIMLKIECIFGGLIYVGEKHDATYVAIKKACY